MTVDLFEFHYGAQVKYNMKFIICICVYNRFENIQKWINIWQQCEQHGAELIVIHNYYGDNAELKKFSVFCNEHKIKYIPRNGQGFDIGAFQDVCKERLPGFNNYWTHMLWCTDDVFPMSKDFLKPFIDTLALPEIGVACMQVSTEVKIHIRTTGFAIRKEVAKKLTFLVDPITTKEDCYRFEHRAKVCFYEQIRAMGLIVQQVATNHLSPLWDSGYTKRVPREKEHEAVFGKLKNKVVFICPIFDAFPQIISSLICQTYKDWELLLIHDGTNDMSKLIEGYGDKRITYIQRPRAAKWGHPLRQWALNEIKAGRLATEADYIVITNGDNYYAPVFIEKMLWGFANGNNAVAVFCENMIHSYVGWNIIPCSLKLGYIDCGGVMVKKNVAVDVGWRDVNSHSSDFTYFNDIIKKYGAGRWAKVKGALFVHNVIVLIIFKLLFYAG